ncbi:ATG13 domain-containing protein [Psidium guajava]|nr:ATG13 domain-containing protein [Psidium guajava]
MGDSNDRIDVKLDGSNYSLWKPSAMAALVYRDLFEHVEGFRLCPVAFTDIDSSKPSLEAIKQRAAEIRAWTIADRKALAIIFGSIDPTLRPQFSHIMGAKCLWDQLAEMFTEIGDIRVYQLEQEIYCATQGSRSIRDFYNYMHSLWSQLDILAPVLCSTCLKCTQCPSTRLQAQDRHRLHAFLMKLGSPYEGIRGQLLHRSPRPSLLDAVKELQSEKTRLGLLSSSTVSDSTAILATPPCIPPTRSSCRPSCTYCHRLGHDESHCWRKKKDVSRPPMPPHPIQHSTSSSLARPVTLASSSTDDRVAAFEAQLARLSPLLGSFPGSSTPAAISSIGSTAAATPSSGDTSTTWILDSGAARHMSASAACLTQLSELKHSAHFFTADGSPLLATQRGTLTVPRDFNVPDVLDVPSLALNLLSVGQLTDAGCIVSFTDSSCFVQDRLSGRTIGRGSRRDELYTMQHLHLPSSSVPVPVLATLDLTRWHQHLGHIPFSRFTVLHQQGALGPISSTSLPPCSICPLAKQSAKPFPISNFRSTAIFDLIHSDVWGPAPLSSKSGFKYYVSFIDNYFRYTWVYLMRQRSDFFAIYQSFTTMISTQFNRKIKVFRSDSGGEYLSGVFRSLLTSDGTLPQLSCPGFQLRMRLLNENSVIFWKLLALFYLPPMFLLSFGPRPFSQLFISLIAYPHPF